jgi:hypothetical protein
VRRAIAATLELLPYLSLLGIAVATQTGAVTPLVMVFLAGMFSQGLGWFYARSPGGCLLAFGARFASAVALYTAAAISFSGCEGSGVCTRFENRAALAAVLVPPFVLWLTLPAISAFLVAKRAAELDPPIGPALDYPFGAP